MQLNAGKQLAIHEEIESVASQLAHLLNLQITGVLVGMHNLLKKELLTMIEDAVNNSGKAVLDSFRTATLEQIQIQKEKKKP